MSELSDTETATKHAESCEKFRLELVRRIEHRTRVVAACTMAWAKDPASIQASELYQMRALYLRFSQVKGHVNMDVPCDARCLSAHGPSCECQCGGKNHGAGNAALIGMVRI